MAQIAYKHLGCRVVKSGQVLEFYDYLKPIHIDYERQHEVKRSQDPDATKRIDNLYRARRSVRQLVWANLTPHTKFLTLTYRDTQLDLKVFQRHFQTFCQAMKRKGFPLRYVYVLERQKKRGKKEGNTGTIHAHLVVFNDEKIPLSVIGSCWPHGSFDIHMLDGLRAEAGKLSDEKIRDAGAYICKYITKDACAEFGGRVFRSSKGLKKPVDLKFYAYGVADQHGIPTFVTENIGFYDFLKSSSNISYESQKKYQFHLSDGSIFKNITFYAQGRINFDLEIG